MFRIRPDPATVPKRERDERRVDRRTEFRSSQRRFKRSLEPSALRFDVLRNADSVPITNGETFERRRVVAGSRFPKERKGAVAVALDDAFAVEQDFADEPERRRTLVERALLQRSNAPIERRLNVRRDAETEPKSASETRLRVRVARLRAPPSEFERSAPIAFDAATVFVKTRRRFERGDVARVDERLQTARFLAPTGRVGKFRRFKAIFGGVH